MVARESYEPADADFKSTVGFFGKPVRECFFLTGGERAWDFVGFGEIDFAGNQPLLNRADLADRLREKGHQVTLRRQAVMQEGGNFHVPILFAARIEAGIEFRRVLGERCVVDADKEQQNFWFQFEDVLFQ